MPHQQITLAVLRQRLKDSYDSAVFWTDTEADLALNEAIRVWNMMTATWKKRVVLSTTAGDHYYSLPGTVIYDMRVDFGSVPMTPGSLFDLDNLHINWEAQTTATSGCPTKPAIWAPVGATLMAIWPADAVGGNEIVIDGVAIAPTLSGDTDYIDISQSDMGAVLSYAISYLAFKGGAPLMAATMANSKKFVEAAFDKNARLKQSTFYRKYMGLDLDRHQRPQRAQTQNSAPSPQGTDQGQSGGE